MRIISNTVRLFAGIALAAVAALAGASVAAAAEGQSPDEPVRLQKRLSAAEVAQQSGWALTLKQGYRQAMAAQKPLLVVVTRESSPAARKLVRELQQSTLENELSRWAVVMLDAAAAADDLQSLGVKDAPALRALTPGGRTVVQSDGQLQGEELADWLDRTYQTATMPTDDALTEEGEPSGSALEKLSGLLGDRSPAVREAAVRRLLPYPAAAAPSVVKVMREGKLSAKLAALEMLDSWQAPTDELDPWRKETLTDARLAELEQWAKTAAGELAEAKGLDDGQMAEARKAIAAMLAAPASEVESLRERLARFGQALMPEVYAQLKAATTDQQRRRLQTLRYRLASSDKLALRWPGGLVRLAAVELSQRQQAAQELVDLATAADQPLLLELFSDPEPAVREIALRGMRRAGGKEAAASLLKLLEDPSLNVRAAVLIQLAESPPANIAAKIRAYLGRETDPDLTVHGIRLLHAAGGRPAMESLVALLEHESWQVRAEAAEALGKMVDRFNRSDNSFTVDAHVAMLKLLADDDAFVVSHAVKALGNVDMAVAVDPLVEAAKKHPELSGDVFRILINGRTMAAKALPRVRDFLEHEDPRVRAAAISGLARKANAFVLSDLFVMLRDPDPAPRIAAASEIFAMRERKREQQASQRFRGLDPFMGMPGDTVDAFPAEASPEDGNSRDVWTSLTRDLSAWRENMLLLVNPQAAIGPHLAPQAMQAGPPLALAQIIGRNAAIGAVAIYQSFRQDSKQARFVTPLLAMLQSKDPREVVAAGCALTSLGRGDLATAKLLSAAEADPQFIRPVGEALPHLAWEQRVAFFLGLLKTVKTDDERAVVIHQMQTVADRRLAELFWPMLRDEPTINRQVQALAGGIQAAYIEHAWGSNITPKMRAALQADAASHTDKGTPTERLAALWLLGFADREAAAEAGAKLLDDDAFNPEQRRDILRVLLVCQPIKEANQRAVAELRGRDAPRRKTALLFLVAGPSAVMREEKAISLVDLDIDERASFSRDGQPIVPKPPAGVEVGDISPLLDDGDARIAAYAGYLLALLGEDKGLDTLIAYWHKNRKEDTEHLDRLVYRAIAALDAGDRLGDLESIYAAYKDSYELREFYWTVRIMSGDKIIALRKRIRDEVGMENLR